MVEGKGRWADALVVAILVTLVLAIMVLPVHADKPVMRAVLFYSTNCPHCHHVITEVLSPLTEQYGEALRIIAVNTSQTEGHELYLAAVEAFEIPPERRGVPTLIVDDVVLVGSLEIPELFPALVEQGLAAGGVDWPTIPGLAEVLARAGPGSIATPTPVLTAAPTLPTDVPSGISANIARDPLGNSFSIAVLCGMVGSIGWVVNRDVRVWRGQGSPSSETNLPVWKAWGVPMLCAIGLVVASYLTFLEPFVIGATCSWCLTSAMMMTLILLLVTEQGWNALCARVPASRSGVKL